jgi:hypothetical protein
MCYQRITEVNDSVPLPVRLSRRNLDYRTTGSRRPGTNQQDPGKTKRNQRKSAFRPKKYESSEDEDDPTHYARVRVVNKVRWSKEDRSPYIEMSGNGLEVWYIEPAGTYPGDYRGWSVRADHPLSFGWRPGDFSYFEITILSTGRNGYDFCASLFLALLIFVMSSIICLGLCSKDVTLDKLPGWEPESWGYHGDDGRAFSDCIFAHVWGPKFTTGDTVGCGLTPNTRRGFFTKNGNVLGEPTSLRDMS